MRGVRLAGAAILLLVLAAAFPAEGALALNRTAVLQGRDKACLEGVLQVLDGFYRTVSLMAPSDKDAMGRFLDGCATRSGISGAIGEAAGPVVERLFPDWPMMAAGGWPPFDVSPARLWWLVPSRAGLDAVPSTRIGMEDRKSVMDRGFVAFVAEVEIPAPETLPDEMVERTLERFPGSRYDRESRKIVLVSLPAASDIPGLLFRLRNFQEK